MKAIATPLFLALLAAGGIALAQAPAVKEKVDVQSPTIALADGGTITIDKDGHTYHVDAKGKRVRMKNGVVMEGKDGRKYMHRNDAIWQQITEKGTLAPNR